MQERKKDFRYGIFHLINHLDQVIVSLTVTSLFMVELQSKCPFISAIVGLGFNWATLVLICVPLKWEEIADWNLSLG